MWLRHFTGTRLPEVRLHRRLVLLKGPWSLWGSRGYAPHGCMGLMAGTAACCMQKIRCCPMVSVQRQFIELPATTVGESSRGGTLRRRKGGLWTVHLISCHHVLFKVWDDLPNWQRVKRLNLPVGQHLRRRGLLNLPVGPHLRRRGLPYVSLLRSPHTSPNTGVVLHDEWRGRGADSSLS